MPDLGMFEFVGERIFEWRTDARMTQEQLSESSGVSKTNLSRYEKGKALPTFATLERILVSLEKEAADLFPPPTAKSFDPRAFARSLWERPEEIGELFGLEPGDAGLNHRDSALDRETRLRLKSAEFRKRTLIATLEYLLEYLEEDDQELGDGRASGEAG